MGLESLGGCVPFAWSALLIPAQLTSPRSSRRRVPCTPLVLVVARPLLTLVADRRPSLRPSQSTQPHLLHLASPRNRAVPPALHQVHPPPRSRRRFHAISHDRRDLARVRRQPTQHTCVRHPRSGPPRVQSDHLLLAREQLGHALHRQGRPVGGDDPPARELCDDGGGRPSRLDARGGVCQVHPRLNLRPVEYVSLPLLLCPANSLQRHRSRSPSSPPSSSGTGLSQAARSSDDSPSKTCKAQVKGSCSSAPTSG